MRQVSFTLLVCWYSDSNRNQYERNTSFRYLVNAVVRKHIAAKLSSVGLWLIASKLESQLEIAVSYECFVCICV